MSQGSLAEVDTADAAYFALNPLLGEFRNRTTEADFRESRLAYDKRYVTVVLITFLATFVLLCGLDYYTFMGLKESVLLQALAARCACAGVLAASLAAVVRARRYKTLIAAYPFLTAGSIIAYSFTAILYARHTPLSMSAAVYVVVCAMSPLLFPIPLRFTIQSSLMIILAAVGTHLFAIGTDIRPVVVMFSTMVVLTILSASFGYGIQTGQRREYASMKMLAASTDSLRTEVERRRVVESELQEHRDNLESLVRKRTEELRESESKLNVAQKLDSIGQLAGGVAHDFNNLLMVILGSAELALSHPSLPEECRGELEQTRRAALQGSQLTRQLLVFSSRQTIDRKPLDMNDVARGMKKMLRRIIPENIVISFDLEEGLAPVIADRGQIEQILMNLVVNARDAVADGGVISVTTRAVKLDPPDVAGNPNAKPGEYAVVSVSDTGHGISQGNLPHIFEPFFTTKERGKGTGLGLAVVFGIVRQHEGFVDVQSELNVGTEFKVYLPSAKGKHVEPPRPESLGALTGTERILLAEDEDQVRVVAYKILTKAGYSVRVVESGEDAVREASSAPEKFDLVVLDLVMPRMNGDEAFVRIRERNRDIPIIFCTGYSDRSIDAGLITQSGAPVLQKPYTMNDILSAVRKALDRHSGAG